MNWALLDGRNAVGLKFNTKEAFSEAMEIVFSGNGEMIPHALVGEWTIIVSRKYVALFKHLKYEHIPGVPASTLRVEALAELRRKNLSFRDR
jgi:hypothetical protein